MHVMCLKDKQWDWSQGSRLACGPDAVRIQIKATALNRADLLQRAGHYPPPPGASPILGLECAGYVLECGSAVDLFSVGDAVCALLAGGGYATEVVVPAGQVLPIPEGLSMCEAAGIPEAFATAYLNLYLEAGLSPGEKVMVHAGASGVGTAAIQLLKGSNNPCFVTVSTAKKLKACLALGADAGMLRQEKNMLSTALHWAGDAGVSVVLDPVGGSYLADHQQILTTDGRLVIIGLMGGRQANLDLGLLLSKRLKIIGSTLRSRTIVEKTKLMQALYTNVWPAFSNGKIKPVIDAVMPISQVDLAHARLAENHTIGKVILQVAN